MKYLSSIYLVLISFNLFVWYWVLAGGKDQALNIYFLNVGQGDSSLVVLPNNIKVLIDGGPKKEILNSLAKVMPATDRYIDLVMLSHPQLDHFSGLIPIMERYQIGAFIYNGRDGTAAAWEDLKKVLTKQKIRTIVLGEGDKIKYEESSFSLLSPNPEFLRSKELNDSCLVAELTSQKSKVLFTCDIGFKVEEYLAGKYDLKSDILKVPHHGSKYSSGGYFLDEVNPALAVIQVGKNGYGHPTQETLSRLAHVGSAVYRNDLAGTVHMRIQDGLAKVFTEK